ncbi:MAG TPA: sulfite exporter TauE/SafE family protein [Candidatus Didemnitutus sp.]|nr:sulfite exporter TauE/SafE family protein [Candidatus Didemnitutus sp.]
MLPTLDAFHWSLLFVGAALVGVSKTGLPGIGGLFVALFSLTLGARTATGVVLPMLLVGDVLAILVYRQHLAWRNTWRLLPWTAAGVVAGWLAFGQLDARWSARLIGTILLGMAVISLVRKLRRSPAVESTPAWLSAATGIIAGFCTLVANAAGPVMNLYLLSKRLPKLEFMGTTAAFFLMLNWFKVPFVVQLGLVTPSSLWLNVCLVPAVIVGAVGGRWLVGRLNQAVFEWSTLILTAVAAARLIATR